MWSFLKCYLKNSLLIVMISQLWVWAKTFSHSPFAVFSPQNPWVLMTNFVPSLHGQGLLRTPGFFQPHPWGSQQTWVKIMRFLATFFHPVPREIFITPWRTKNGGLFVIGVELRFFRFFPKSFLKCCGKKTNHLYLDGHVKGCRFYSLHPNFRKENIQIIESGTLNPWIKSDVKNHFDIWNNLLKCRAQYHPHHMLPQISPPPHVSTPSLTAFLTLASESCRKWAQEKPLNRCLNKQMDIYNEGSLYIYIYTRWYTMSVSSCVFHILHILHCTHG